MDLFDALTPPTIDAVIEAAARLRGHINRTPLLEFQDLNERLDGRILIKPENLQRTGSFKFRGAFNRISVIDEAARKNGVVAYSSGNHAQGVAAAAKHFGIPALIVMPKDAPKTKRDNTRKLGAEVVLYDRATESREKIAGHLCEERGATLIRPFDDPLIIAGQGTIGLELAEQSLALEAKPDAILVPCGGGGLISGISIAVAETIPGAAVYSVEPDGFDDTARSLASGRIVHNEAGAVTLCDALMSAMPGDMTFAINRCMLSGGLSVSEDAVQKAMAYAHRHLKLVIEPGGVVGLAAALSETFDCRGKTVAIVCSGGNVDQKILNAALRAAKDV